VDWLSFPCSVLTLRFRSELGLAIRVIMGITPMAITDRIRTMAIIGLTIGTAGTAITATTVIITTIGTKLT
jgi:hypothetical protein